MSRGETSAVVSAIIEMLGYKNGLIRQRNEYTVTEPKPY